MSECQVCDNTVTIAWTLPEPDSKIDHYILEHRRTNHEGPPRIREDYPWMVLEGIKEMEHTLTGRRKDCKETFVIGTSMTHKGSFFVFFCFSQVCASTPAT